nr:FAD:protein FMN transferase [Lewinella sp. JB7]
MGTPWSVIVYATDTLTARKWVEAAFARIEAVEQSMSDYRTDSEINRLVRRTPRMYHPVSCDLYRVLRFSRALARRSGGAFDPTVGPLSKLWRRAIRHQTLPTEEELRQAGTRVQWKYLRLRRPNRVWLARDDLQLDLGGVAKGYALDAAGDVLRSAGLDCFLIDGGGDLLLGAPPPGRTGWEIQTPDGPVTAARVAIATSGAEYRHLEWEGRRYSHLVDPRTGLGIAAPRPVTVMAPRAMVADGLASAVSVMEEEAGHRLLRRYGLQ